MMRTINLDRELHKRFKSYCAIIDKEMREVVEELIKKELEKQGFEIKINKK